MLNHTHDEVLLRITLAIFRPW